MNETWKPVLNYEDLYEVSDKGNVRTLERVWYSGEHYQVARKIIPKLKNQKADQWGYLRVTLCKNGKKKRRSVHSLVLESFVGTALENAQCRHLDGNKENNSLENLKWGTIKENAQDKKKHGTQRGMDGRTHTQKSKRKISTAMRRWHKERKNKI